MSTFPPTTTVFNDGYIAETYERYRRDPSSVDESWRQFFRTAESLAGITGSVGGVADAALLRKTAGAAALVGVTVKEALGGWFAGENVTVFEK